MNKLQDRIGYHFKNQALLSHALTHSSYINEHHLVKEDCNERLEFLGDSILEMVSSAYLYENYPGLMEGGLSKLRASLVCEMGLANAAEEIDLGSCLLLGKGMEQEGGRRKDSITSDAFEALIAAIFLDGGLEEAKKLIMDHVLNDIDEKVLFYDAKTNLQEILQDQGLQVTYRLVREIGPAHEKSFECAAVIREKDYGIGSGRTKKQAEQLAAYETIKMIREDATCI